MKSVDLKCLWGISILYSYIHTGVEQDMREESVKKGGIEKEQ